MSRGSQSTVAVVVLARLQWSPTEVAYFSLSTCPGEPTTLSTLLSTHGALPHLSSHFCVLADKGIVLCGDEEGSVWIYDVRHLLMQQPPLPAAPQAPTQVCSLLPSLPAGIVQPAGWHLGGTQPPSLSLPDP